MINFPIGVQKIALEIVMGFAYLKKSCAIVNSKKNRLCKEKAAAILQTCDEIINNEHNGQFSLYVWQSDSDIQTNTNVNEVIALRATQILDMSINNTLVIDATKDVNMSQNSNDAYSTAMRIACVLEIEKRLAPSIKVLKRSFKTKAKEYDLAIKAEKVEQYDSKVLTIGQEIGVHIQMLKKVKKQIKQCLKYLRELDINTNITEDTDKEFENFSNMISKVLNKQIPSKSKFKSRPNKVHGLATHDAEVMLSGTLNTLASNLIKISNDVRYQIFETKCVMSEINQKKLNNDTLILDEKEYIRQCETMSIVCAQIMGNHTTISVSASHGNFELNVFKPVIAYNLLQSIRLLGDIVISFNNTCVQRIK